MRRRTGHLESAAGTPAIRVETCPSELGWVALAWRGPRLRALTFGHASAAAAVRALGLPVATSASIHQGTLDGLAARVCRYAAGAVDDFRDVPVDWEGYTDFQRRVLEQCRRIAYGTTRTYAELAARVGSPGAARAVGQTMARNRLPLVIPCHRVIGSGGALCGFSAPAGLVMKRRLLRLEGLDKEWR